MQWMFAALLAMSVTIVLLPFLMRYASYLRVMDKPDPRKVHAEPIPRVGGIAMGVALLLVYLLWGMQSSLSWPYFFSTLVILLFGIQDDRLDLSPAWKFFGQGLAALIIMFPGGLMIEWFYAGRDFQIPMLIAGPLTFFVLIGFTNAVNLADGLDGLAGGLSLLCLIGVLLMAASAGSSHIAMLSAAGIGAIIGFLRFNTHPARIFMGDAGSQLLGFSIAVLSLSLCQHVDLPYSAAMPILLVGMPILDTITVMFTRILSGKSPFSADRGHVHHKLIDLGFYHHEVVMLIYSVQIIFMTLAWIFRYASDVTILAIFGGVSIVINWTLQKLKHRGWCFREKGSISDDSYSLFIDKILSKLRLGSFALIIFVFSYFVLLIINGFNFKEDIHTLAFLLMISLVVFSILQVNKVNLASIASKSILYVCAVLAVWMDKPNYIFGNLRIWLEGMIFVGFCILLLAKATGADRKVLEISAMDLLVVLVAIILPNLPGTVISNFFAGWLVAKIIILFYVIEAIYTDKKVYVLMLNSAFMVFLLSIILQ